MKDVLSNHKHKCWKLSHLALEYGIAVDPSKLHSALADIELTAQLLQRAGTTLHEIKTYHDEPTVVLRAVVPPKWEDKGVGTDAAKKLGFSWEQPRGVDKKFEKCWVKAVKKQNAEVEIAKATFPIRILEEIL
jgi:hypothetical protein